MRLLHLEDSQNDADLVAEMLRTEWPDCRIERVDRKAEFEEALGRGDFDLIVSDYTLPDFDGLSALEMAQAKRPQKPFIFLSGTIGEERAVNALKRGATDYVIKNHLPHLLPVIRQALAFVAETARRQKSEEALRQNQERFRTITENVADLIVMFDLSGRRTYTNPAYQWILGDDATQARDAFAEVHPEDRLRVLKVFREIVHTGAGRRTDYRFLLPDGRVRHIEANSTAVCDADGCVTHVLEVSRDVTERRKAELQLREQAALLDKARDAIVATDAGLRVTYWNASAERLYGWKATEAVGRKLGELHLGFDVPKFIAAQTKVERDGEWRGEFQLRTKTGKPVHVESTWSLVAGPAGQPSSILFIDTDISERKQLETALLRSQRLESIGTLAGGVAHDLNNVLTPILLTTDLLRPKVDGDEEGTSLIGSIESSVQHGAALVKQLLAFARGGSGERTTVQMAAVMPDLESLIRTSLPDTVELIVRSRGALWPIHADVTQLKQVLVNLCINARDAMPAGGKIDVLVENFDVGPELTRLNPGAHTGPHLAISVSDTGPGIPPDIAERIFDPFFTTKPAGKGTGLGLSVVAGIIKGHGGFLQMHSVMGRGTTFRIFLPVQTVHVTPQPVQRTPAFPVLANQEGVLVVDDEPIVRSVVKMLLERSGFRVFLAVNGLDGLEKFQTHRRDIEVVLTDMNMPEMDGAEFIIALRKIDPAQRIVILSGSMDTETFERPVPGPTIECLTKPPSPARLLDTIRKNLAANAA